MPEDSSVSEARKRPVVIACAAYKGGVAKSFTATWLAGFLAEKKHRVLVVDACSLVGQATSFNTRYNAEKTLDAYLKETATAKDIVVKTNIEGIDMVPGHKDLVSAQPVPNTYMSIMRLVDELSGSYDFVCVDVGPSGDILAQASLIAADYVIVPTMLDLQASVNGLTLMDRVLADVNKMRATIRLPPVKDLGIYINAFDKDAPMHTALVDELRKKYGARIRRHVIPVSRLPQRALNEGKPINYAFPQSPFVKKLRALFEELYAEVKPKARPVIEVVA